MTPNLIDVMAENRTWQLLASQKRLNRLFLVPKFHLGMPSIQRSVILYTIYRAGTINEVTNRRGDHAFHSAKRHTIPSPKQSNGIPKRSFLNTQ